LARGAPNPARRASSRASRTNVSSSPSFPTTLIAYSLTTVRSPTRRKFPAARKFAGTRAPIDFRITANFRVDGRRGSRRIFHGSGLLLMAVSCAFVPSSHQNW
jgi:hypothetical protein